MLSRRRDLSGAATLTGQGGLASVRAMPKDYSLTGASAAAAKAAGMAGPTWYRTDVDPAAIRNLMQKSDTRAGRDAVLWLGLIALFGGLAIVLWPSWWSVPFWLAYGVLYGSGADARWHECGHRTAFRTPWMNEVIYQIASFMLIRDPTVWRASHVRHHTDTIIVGRDPEIQLMRPPDLAKLAINIFGIADVWTSLHRLALHARGRIHPDEADFLREDMHRRVILTARIWVAIFAATGLAAIAFQSVLPLLLIGGPRIYGSWHMVMTGSLQHLGLAENVTDHRLNTRTVLMNPVSRFIYLNMNYHIEHHMFTMVPYYHLPDLHRLIAHDLPAPDPSILSAIRRLVPVLIKQLKDEKAVILPELPEGATPFGAEAEHLRPHAV